MQLRLVFLLITTIISMALAAVPPDIRRDVYGRQYYIDEHGHPRLSVPAEVNHPPFPVLEIPSFNPPALPPQPSSSREAKGKARTADAQEEGSSRQTRLATRRAAPSCPVASSVEPAAKKSRMGRPNFKPDELDALLDLIAHHQPAGQRGWQTVAEEYLDWAAENGGHKWTSKQLEDKFKNLVRKKPRSGQPRPNQHVERALQIDRAINDRIHVDDLQDDDSDDSQMTVEEDDSDVVIAKEDDDKDDEGEEQLVQRRKAKGKGKEKEVEGGKEAGKENQEPKQMEKEKKRLTTDTASTSTSNRQSSTAGPIAIRTHTLSRPQSNRLRQQTTLMENLAHSMDPSVIASRDRAITRQVEELSQLGRLERQLENLQDRFETLRADHTRLLSQRRIRDAAQLCRWTPLFQSP